MTLLVGTDLAPEAAAALIRFADRVDAGGWVPDGRASADGWESGMGTRSAPDALSSTARLVHRDGSRLSIHREGSATCGFELESRGGGTIHLQLDLTPPRNGLAAGNRAATAAWAAGVARIVHAADRVPYREAVHRAAAHGHAVAIVAGLHDEETLGGLSWHPPTPWTEASFGDVRRFMPIPTAAAALLRERTQAIGLVVPAKASAFTRWTHRIHRLDVGLDEDERPSATETMRMLRDLGLTAAHFVPDEA